MTIEQKILDAMKGMEGIGGIPTPEEYFAEFDMRVRAAIGIVDYASLPCVSSRDKIERLERDLDIVKRLADKRSRIMQEWIKKYNLPIANAALDSGS